VVAGWWNVNDAAAAQLMMKFYRGWTKDEHQKNIASALRRAKLDWLYDPQVSYQYKLPYYWAALNYAGNPEPLKASIIPNSHTWLWWIIAVLAAAGLFVIILRFRR